MINVLYEKTLNESTMDKKTHKKEGEGLKTLYNHFRDKRKDSMNTTEKSYQDIFDDNLRKTLTLVDIEHNSLLFLVKRL